MIFVELFVEFFKIGLFAVGGGLATLPFLADLTITHPQWFDMEMLGNMVAVSNATPGPIGVNMATYVGFTVGGFWGSLIATFSLVLPSMIVVLLVAKVLDRFAKNEYVLGAFTGLRPAVTGLIALAGFELVKISLFNQALYEQSKNILDLLNIGGIAFMICVAVLIKKTKFPILVYILIGAVAGMVFKL